MKIASILLSTIAIAMSAVSLAMSMRSGEPVEGAETIATNYSFDTPLNAYRSRLQMIVNKDWIGMVENDFAVRGEDAKEKLETLQVKKTREHDGKMILFVEYNKLGLPVQNVVAFQKDNVSGMWRELYFSSYDVRDDNPGLAAEIRQWVGMDDLPFSRIGVP